MSLSEADNPETGTDVESAIAQHLLNRGAARQAETTAKSSEPETDTAETEADEKAAKDAKAETDGESAESEDATDTGEEAETDEPEEDQPTYTVKIHGQEVKVTLPELLKGYERDGDYRKKTSELAEQRKAVEAERQRIADVNAKRDQYIEELSVLEELNSKPPFTQEQLDKLLASDAPAYIRAKDANDKHGAALQEIRNRKSAAENSRVESQKQEFAKMAADEQAALVSAMPELASEEARIQLGKYALTYGYTPEQVEQTVDHRVFLMAEKARRYDEMMAKKAEKPIAKAPKVLTGKAPAVDAAQEAERNLKEIRATAKKSGSTDDLARYLLAKKANKRK